MDEEKKDTGENQEPAEGAGEQAPGADGQEEDAQEAGQEPALAARPAGEEAAVDEAARMAEKAKAQANDELLKTRERMLRIAADFENFRKRAKKDLDEAEHKARVDILKEMLPIFDNLARAVEHGTSVSDVEPVIQGARMVTKQFEENLAKFGLKRIESVGRIFDPSVHDAIAQEESDEAAPGTIIKEFLAGYMLGDKLLRAAMVVVAKAGKGAKEDG